MRRDSRPGREPASPVGHPHRAEDPAASSRYDPATPYAWARNIRPQARGHTALLTYDGWGHGVYQRSDCTRGAVDVYLFDLRVPADLMVGSITS